MNAGWSDFIDAITSIWSAILGTIAIVFGGIMRIISKINNKADRSEISKLHERIDKRITKNEFDGLKKEISEQNAKILAKLDKLSDANSTLYENINNKIDSVRTELTNNIINYLAQK